MKKEHKIMLLAIAAIAALDAAGSMLSKRFDFDYSMLWPFSVIIGFCVAYKITRLWGGSMAILFAIVLGIFDATVGLKIFFWLGPDYDDLRERLTSTGWIITLVLAIVFYILAALLAIGVEVLARKRKKSGQKSN